MREETEGLMHLKVFLPTRPVTLIKEITSPYKFCFNSKHSTFLGSLWNWYRAMQTLKLSLILKGLRDFWWKPSWGSHWGHGDMHDWKAAACSKWSAELERWRRNNSMTQQDVLKTQMISLLLMQPHSVMLGKTLKLNFAKWALQCYLLHRCSPLGLLVLFEKCWGSALPLRSQICVLDSHKNSLYLSVFRIH